MIKATDIYAATHDGLDIILYYYPQAEGCVDNKKKFKRRPDEDDASACLKKFQDCYKVTDFGDSGSAMSPIDICMNEENVRFPEAVALLASRYNVTDELKRSVNKPDIRKRPATADEAEGSRFFELEEKFTDATSVRAIASHCVMSGPASERVQNSQLEEIVFTDSIPYSNRCAKVKQLSIADMFAETIRRVMTNESISSQYLL